MRLQNAAKHQTLQMRRCDFRELSRSKYLKGICMAMYLEKNIVLYNIRTETEIIQIFITALAGVQILLGVLPVRRGCGPMLMGARQFCRGGHSP